ncbi:1-acyl-sn-glycerol-3-phosphate acyltransferase [Schaalia hyovaginalis]|uniref:1-acyl-sn-glycerol-3-phosphate acyltransferase n=1 Tax=Schaalia hyovaginalis TaxID=29316 RepID=A0A923E2L3_9ACTO|nr:lysophospholipid acyltransferase family protein [Schaalia hyovaginalis]MBB6334843.1 1-acyl-sn-glycerol-3-phosphate acyltransferase [Schaalia hyovaginalis]MCI7672483.1 1-acyl-sn-glycerol-3-phosphate acyltransferase [Schaalia hyovaginalis]MDY2668242.1 lysophospholipid acyltransferase family protein [Schaalia hyovaginalis]MDY5506392.1 lysophospholipid acyltransferase family protein [Schaalia hyovaginalis]
MAFYQALKATGGPILKAAYKPWIRGKENVPESGPAILASNHNAVWDSVFLPMMLDREVVFMGKADYFTGTGVKGWATKEFMRAVGTIPVDRSGGSASEGALKAGLERLRSGELFGIYPEGTRSPDGRLYRGKTGVARLALLSGAPVIPVAMIGTHAAQPIGQKFPSRTNIGMVIGEPLDFSRYKGLHKDRFVLRAITDEIMYNLMLLSGQEYVDLYAADVKAKLAAEGKFDGPVPTNGRPGPGGRTAPVVEVPRRPEDPREGEGPLAGANDESGPTA